VLDNSEEPGLENMETKNLLLLTLNLYGEKGIAFSYESSDLCDVQLLPPSRRIVPKENRSRVIQSCPDEPTHKLKLDLVDSDGILFPFSKTDSPPLTLYYLKSKTETFRDIRPFVILSFNIPPNRFSLNKDPVRLRFTLIGERFYQGYVTVHFRVISMPLVYR
jgi:hypothetical protein